jgi:putative two-component system response regulator
MPAEIRVLIVEDNRTNLMLMEMLVRQVPNCRAISFTDPQAVVADLATLEFDIAIVDYQMPGMNGIELIGAIRKAPHAADKPVVMVTADRDARIRLDAIHAGAMEFLNKPIEPIEFKARIANLARLSEAQRKLENQAEWLRAEVDKATLELRRREEEIINRLALAAGYKDRETGAHTIRMARYCGILARRLGLPEETCRDIQLAAPMHDIGKVGIRDNVLLKNGSLDAAERAHINEHTAIGGRILAGSQCDLLRLASEIAVSHHERWDGAGYPAGLAGDAIPLSGRIAAVADVFDALTTARPYKAAWSVDRAFAHLREQAGSQFDPDCVRAFELGREEIEATMRSVPEAAGHLAA